MKTKEELNELQKEIEDLNKKLAELTEEELVLVAGGTPDRKDPGSQKNAKIIFIED